MSSPPAELAGCDVWWATPVTVSARHLAVLDRYERRRYERHEAAGNCAVRDRHATAAVVLRALLARYTGHPANQVRVDRTCPGCGESHGKPRLPEFDLYVSVSHADDLIGVAVTRVGPVGIDVERIDRTLDHAALARYVLSRDEVLGPSATDLAGAFHRAWTRKESILKATGDGLRVPLPTLTLSAADRPARLLTATTRPDLPSRAHITDLRPTPDHLAAVTVLSHRHETPTVNDRGFVRAEGSATSGGDGGDNLDLE